MAQFRTKAAVVEAVRWDGHFGSIQRLLLGAAGASVAQGPDDPGLIVEGPGNGRRVAVGDWLVCAGGTLAPCPPALFAALLEEVR